MTTTPALSPRPWLSPHVQTRIDEVSARVAVATPIAVNATIDALITENRNIHDRDCINLNPATNIMNPRAEAMLSAGLGSRPSLGYPGDKYEMGLEAIEEIEVIAAETAAQVFNAKYAEIRVPSGAIANLYAFMANAEPGDTIIAPPASIGGHITHHAGGSAGMFRLNTLAAPVNADGYTVDIDALRTLAHGAKPSMITIGSSLNLQHHPVAAVREIADEVGATVLFDAAHLCGIIAGGAWPNPLDEGAHLITMSTYKSLGGPAGGLIVTNDAEIAQRLETIAFPGLTANFDAAKSAALAVTMLDWQTHGHAYADMMVSTAAALAHELQERGLPAFTANGVPTISHQFALEAARWGGGQAAAKQLRLAGILTCGIGLPIDPVNGDMNGLRFGTPEIVRLGMKTEHMADLADLIADGLAEDTTPSETASQVTGWRQKFQGIHYVSV
ncbi:aminotransferase class I/II-fold pyridoxal phosphate-dependent enzyme [Ornithinimicrobium sp. Arc0846-15]|nr:aminotransferase class I/II-fold pyridoxal phosphate-dependent enzyme [Ornithinimicrobium laminariae]